MVIIERRSLLCIERKHTQLHEKKTSRHTMSAYLEGIHSFGASYIFN